MPNVLSLVHHYYIATNLDMTKLYRSYQKGVQIDDFADRQIIALAYLLNMSQLCIYLTWMGKLADQRRFGQY